MKVAIYHNPRCSKSRAMLALLRERGVEPEIVAYLETPPDAATLRRLLKALGMTPRELLRRQEAPYRARRLDLPGLGDDGIIEVIVKHPVLMERPIVVAGARGHQPAARARAGDPAIVGPALYPILRGSSWKFSSSTTAAMATSRKWRVSSRTASKW
jgi:arsenate reductase